MTQPFVVFVDVDDTLVRRDGAVGTTPDIEGSTSDTMSA
jgi:hypothetical protein